MAMLLGNYGKIIDMTPSHGKGLTASMSVRNGRVAWFGPHASPCALLNGVFPCLSPRLGRGATGSG
jgi:hypothetical protein